MTFLSSDLSESHIHNNSRTAGAVLRRKTKPSVHSYICIHMPSLSYHTYISPCMHTRVAALCFNPPFPGCHISIDLYLYCCHMMCIFQWTNIYIRRLEVHVEMTYCWLELCLQSAVKIILCVCMYCYGRLAGVFVATVDWWCQMFFTMTPNTWRTTSRVLSILWTLDHMHQMVGFTLVVFSCF